MTTEHVISTGTVVLEGDAVAVASSICRQVVDPVATAFAKTGGSTGVIELYAGLITYLVLDATNHLGEDIARQILSCAGERVTDLLEAGGKGMTH